MKKLMHVQTVTIVCPSKDENENDGQLKSLISELNIY